MTPSATSAPFSPSTTTRLDRVARKYSKHRLVHGLRFEIHRRSDGATWAWRDAAAPDQYFIASITKLFTTAIVFQLVDEGRLSLDSRMADLIATEDLRGLSAHNGRDAAPELTVRHLLSHTSGIPDYFEGRVDGTTLMERMIEADLTWHADDALALARSQRPRFAPGAPGKALYSDTNFQLLQSVVESLDGASFAESLERRITSPLGLTQTYLFTRASRDRYDSVTGLYDGDKQLHIPGAMASFGADGAMVSTASDQIRFLDALVSGDLFSANLYAEATAQWNRIFPPLRYGVGMMRHQLPRIMVWGSPLPPLVGHSGAAGTVLFADEAGEYLFAGGVNQVRTRPLVFRLMTQLQQALSRD